MRVESGNEGSCSPLRKCFWFKILNINNFSRHQILSLIISSR